MRKTLLSPSKKDTPVVSNAIDVIPAFYFESIGLLFWDIDQLWTFPLLVSSYAYCLALWPVRMYYLFS